jgi:checkpoint serine/threonine-protein kinase
MYLYDKESFLLLKYSDHGTLQDVINHYKRSKIASKKTMDEYIAMFYTIELLRIVETLHNECNIIHCDIRPENLLILNENCKVWENWTKEGAKGWECKGLKLIDFGNCIDMKLYPKGTMFQGEGPIKCIEMQTGKPWTYQVCLQC